MNDGLDDLVRCLMQTGVDNFKSFITQCTRNDLGATIMAIKTWLSNNNSIGTLHDL